MTTAIDVFNGDADGICALQQLRLQTPRPQARLVTGVKRDIGLLERIGPISGGRITVLDISLDSNRTPLVQLLAQGNKVFYADHHFSGEIPAAAGLTAHIDPSPQTCTSLIIDRLLEGAHRTWALAGAYGDNLDEVAREQAQAVGLDETASLQLREIGRLLNYNGYGLAVEDLLIHPADLFREVNLYPDPFTFHRDAAVLIRLRAGYQEDMARAAALVPVSSHGGGRVFVLPACAWANRVVGVFANQIAREQPEKAHAALLARPDDGFLVSVRAPLATRQGADMLCRQFISGGGRAAAAGINHLPASELDVFLTAFTRHFPG